VESKGVTTEDIVGSWRKLECGRIGEEWSSEEEGEKRRVT
jgi:hypothetical protein